MGMAKALYLVVLRTVMCCLRVLVMLTSRAVVCVLSLRAVLVCCELRAVLALHICVRSVPRVRAMLLCTASCAYYVCVLHACLVLLNCMWLGVLALHCAGSRCIALRCVALRCVVACKVAGYIENHTSNEQQFDLKPPKAQLINRLIQAHFLLLVLLFCIDASNHLAQI